MKILIHIICVLYTASAIASTDYIATIEKYFNSISTMEADFEQIDRNGCRSKGRFFLSRPSCMKMDYIDPPTHVVIVKDRKITHYNREMKEKSIISAHSSPLSIFLERNLKLRDKVQIISKQECDDGVLQIKLRSKTAEEAGCITLFFSQQPFELIQWIIHEKNTNGDNDTIIYLLKRKKGKPIPQSIFEKM